MNVVLVEEGVGVEVFVFRSFCACVWTVGVGLARERAQRRVGDVFGISRCCKSAAEWDQRKKNEKVFDSNPTRVRRCVLGGYVMIRTDEKS